MDEDSLHRRSLEQEPIHSLNELGGTRLHTHTCKRGHVSSSSCSLVGTHTDDEQRPAEVVVKNPLVALKAISKDFKNVSASEEVLLSSLPPCLFRSFALVLRLAIA
jgi:hypothetical protein